MTCLQPANAIPTPWLMPFEFNPSTNLLNRVCAHFCCRIFQTAWWVFHFLLFIWFSGNVYRIKCSFGVSLPLMIFYYLDIWGLIFKQRRKKGISSNSLQSYSFMSFTLSATLVRTTTTILSLLSSTPWEPEDE